MTTESTVIIGPVLTGNDDIVCERTEPKPAEQFERPPQVFPLQDDSPWSER